MATLVSIVGASPRAVVARQGDCTIVSSAHISGRPCSLKTLRCGQSSRIIQLRSNNRETIPSRGGGSGHSRVVFASRDEIPSEILEEDSKFVPINVDDPRFGPSAILLLGFTNEEAITVRNLLKEMEGDFMQVLLCTEEMAKGTLGKAIDVVQPNLMEVQVGKGLPRISFLSGLTGEEIMMLIKTFPDLGDLTDFPLKEMEIGLEPTVFAAHVPLNSDKSVAEVLEEIMDDHRRLTKQAEAVEQKES